MEIKASGTDKKEEAADFAAGFGRLAAEMLENARAMPVHPLMLHPAAAFAAATAIGFGFSTQIAGAFFGAMQSAMETSKNVAAALDDTPPDELKTKLDIRPENIRAVEPVVKAEEPVKKPVAKPKLTVVAATPEPLVEAAPIVEVAPIAKAKPVAQKKLVAVASPAVEVTPVVKAKAAPRAKKSDDLKLIAGIGPKLEQVLNEKGVRSFADIIGWSADDVAKIDAELGFGGRILRDDWAGQAKVLAGRGRKKT